MVLSHLRSISLVPAGAAARPKRCGAIALTISLASASVAVGQGTTDLDAGQAAFETYCGSCHGGDGRGGEYAPDIVTPGVAVGRSDKQVREIIQAGLPERGMPAISVPEPELGQLLSFYGSLTKPASRSSVAGSVESGEQVFRQRGCADCHVPGAALRIRGPDLARIGTEQTLEQIRRSITEPSSHIAAGYAAVRVRLSSGESIEGFARNRSALDLQLQTFDGEFRFLALDDVATIDERTDSLMPDIDLDPDEQADLLAFLSRQDGSGALADALAGHGSDSGIPFERILRPRPGEWPTYNGRLDGNRHSQLDQIHQRNVNRLELAWMYPLDSPNLLETTPVVVDGVMYVTFSNEIHALDALHGRRIWSYSQPRTPDILGAAARAANRGVAVLGERVFMVTDHAHLLAFDRVSGRKLWDVEMADYRENYNATMAPLIVREMVVSGISGGDQGVRGFLAAYDPETGRRLWRFWTIPLPGEPLAETWQGSVLPHGCGTTWLTGTYDAELDLLYWPTGNPCPDMNGDERLGDNLYSNSILALRPNTGTLAWHFQYTPHDEHDWDSVQTPVLADIEWHGVRRKVLLHANRNGFFYVLDREDGELLLAEPFVRKLTWAERVGADGRPVLVPGKRPTRGGNLVCPGLQGATNWPSKSFDPATGLFYTMASEFCHVFTKRDETWQAGKTYYGGTAREPSGEPGERYLRAIDVLTGEIAWERKLGDSIRDNWSGVVSTAAGLVFFADNSGTFSAARAADGELLWSRHLNARVRASPMTYMLGGRQFVTIAAGKNILAFALPPAALP